MRAGDTADHGAHHFAGGELDWRRSSHSGGGNDCVEIAVSEGRAGIRDSKDETGAALWITRGGWDGLRAAVTAGPAA